MNKASLAVIATFIFTILPAAASSASSFKSKFNSKALQVNFINNTRYACKITRNYLKHGQWDIKPPDEIGAYNESIWDATQYAFHGPDIALTFKCGDYSFSVKNQQDFSALVGGGQHNATYDVDNHLRVTNREIQRAATVQDIPGIAEIKVSLKRHRSSGG
ncbi:hypothetical protein [Candidatus Sororendozoicomonas aggregata]|uniref:hypothetical protein n=1 Tax=Candidatus Sororendozoicomonas aggregata TaxID=3073239 RepID=UPI002ED4658E